MRVLAIDTSQDACAVAIVEGGRVLALGAEAMARGHQERLAPIVAEALLTAGLRAGDLDRVGVTIGPGSFTGLRVGLAFAKGLSLAAGKPLVGVGVLDALIAAVDSQGPAAAAVGARHDRVHLQIGGAEPYAASVTEALAAIADAGAKILTGPAASRLASLGCPARIVPQASPDIAVVARLASGAAPTRSPRLLYLREPDARTLVERARP